MKPCIGRDSSRRGSRGAVKTGFARGPVPILEGGGAGGGGKLRIERQQNDAVGRELPHRQRRAVAERMPVAHRDKGPDFQLRRPQRGLQSPGLALGFLQDRRAAARYGR